MKGSKGEMGDGEVVYQTTPTPPKPHDGAARLRPVVVGVLEAPARFHQWHTAPGGDVYAIVEFRNGNVDLCDMDMLRFTDRPGATGEGESTGTRPPEPIADAAGEDDQGEREEDGEGVIYLKNMLITERQAAALLCMSVKTLQRWRALKKGPYYLKLGGAVRYQVRHLEEFAGVPLGD